MGLFNDYKQVM